MFVLLFYVNFILVDDLLQLLNSQLSVYLRFVLYLLRVLSEPKSSYCFRQMHLVWRAGDYQSGF